MPAKKPAKNRRPDRARTPWLVGAGLLVNATRLAWDVLSALGVVESP